MSAITKIEWCDRTWNCIRGCSVISPGCTNCYAMKQAHRFSGPGKPFEGLTKATAAGPQWTGVVRTVEAALLEPLSWRKPQRVFVNSMSDLFHEDVPFEFIDKVFAVMAWSHRHTFQILTKRPERMRAYLTAPDVGERIVGDAMCNTCVATNGRLCGYAGESCQLDGELWPLPNVWLGVSVEDQKHADERIPLLLQTPAAVRFISAEPLLGPVDLFDYLPLCRRTTVYPDQPSVTDDVRGALHKTNLDWVIGGGESGPGARPCDLAWIRSIVEQCHAARVPVFVKQLGAKPLMDRSNDGITITLDLLSRKGGDPSEWPEYFRRREFPEVVHAS